MDNLPQSIDQLDLFKTLGLTSLTEEEKVAYTTELLGIALDEVINNEIPKHLSEEEISKFSSLFDNDSTRNQGIDLLKEKLPNFEDLLKKVMVGIKKDVIQGNFEERIEVNKVAREQLRQQPDNSQVNSQVLRNEQERTNLEQIMQAISVGDWKKVESLGSIITNPNLSPVNE